MNENAVKNVGEGKEITREKTIIKTSIIIQSRVNCFSTNN